MLEMAYESLGFPDGSDSKASAMWKKTTCDPLGQEDPLDRE